MYDYIERRSEYRNVQFFICNRTAVNIMVLSLISESARGGQFAPSFSVYDLLYNFQPILFHCLCLCVASRLIKDGPFCNYPISVNVTYVSFSDNVFHFLLHFLICHLIFLRHFQDLFNDFAESYSNLVS